MTDALLRIRGGYVFDPANGRDGQTADIWIADGKIVPAPTDPDACAARTIDAAGLVVMPGGVDMHAHIAGPKVNVARKMRPEERRRDAPLRRTVSLHSGTYGSVPTTFATGYQYACLGYTTAFDAAVPPLAARHAHEEFDDMPCIDKGFFVMLGNNHYVMREIEHKDQEKLTAFVGWLLSAAKGYAAKLVNPGGVEVWKHRAAGNVRGIDDPVDPYHVTPRQIVRHVAQAIDALQLPHAVHIHCNNLGMPGNWRTTMETFKSLEGHRGHLTHVQFHSYGGGDEDEDSFSSRVAALAEYVNEHANVTVDVGQVMFGDTTSMTGDGPLGYYLHNIYGTKWFSGDIEMETGCGIAPITYRNKSRIHSIQWAAGLEWFLLVDDPWRIAMSTDHPNGASFMSYPEIIRLLMDREYRREVLKTVHPAVLQHTTLGDLDREYTLSEICIITRAAPARILGLKHKGHLGPGADADVTIYTPNENRRRMFEVPRYVIKAGRIIVDDAELRDAEFGTTLHVAPEYDRGIEPDIARWFEQYYSIQFRNYPVADDYLRAARLVQ